MAKEKAKKYPAKKLPKIFRKKYSSKKFNSKILKKLTVPKDKKAVEELFEKGKDSKNRVIYSVSMEKQFSKAELKNFKVLSKQIKGQKGRIKFLPLIACVSFIVLTVIAAGIFKNPLAKKAVIGLSESAFGAKCEVKSVNVEIFGARITIKGYSIGNKNSVMTNLFEADLIDLDFNLTQALLGRFNAENLEVSGMNFNTPRETSCELPVKEKKLKEQKSESEFFKGIQAKNDEALSSLKEMALDFTGSGNPQEIADEIIASLATPGMVEEVKSSGTTVYEKWKDKPEELAVQAKKFSSDVQELQSIDVSKINDITVLKQDIEKIDAAIKSGNAIKSNCEKVEKEFNSDLQSVKNIANNAQSSIKKDTDAAKKKVSGIITTISDPKGLFNQALNTVAYSYMGKYYDYAQVLYSYAKQIKISSDNKAKSENSKEKPKKQGSKRLSGTTFWYKTGSPSLLIEKVHVSGPGFDATVKEITNDPDIRGLPVTAQLSLEQKGVNHKANLVVDARSSTEAPLITVEYRGSGFNMVFDGASVAEKCGIPSIDSKADLKINMNVDWNDDSASLDVLGNGLINLTSASISSDGFENEVISKYYNDALSNVKKLSVNFKTNYTAATGLGFDLTGDFSGFVSGFKKSASNASKDLQDAVMTKVKERLSGCSSEITTALNEVNGLKSGIENGKKLVSDSQKALEAKKAEIEKQIKNSAKKAGSDALGNALKGFGF